MMNTRSRIVAAALVATVPFALTACGNSEASQAKKAIKAEIVKSSQDSTSPLKFDDAQAGCFADKVVDDLGVSDLKKAGLLTTDGKNANNLKDVKVSTAQATKIVDDMWGCTDNGKSIMALFTQEMAGSLSSLPAAAQTCIKDKIDEAMVKKVIVATLSEGDTSGVQSQIEQLAMGCMSSH